MYDIDEKAKQIHNGLSLLQRNSFLLTKQADDIDQELVKYIEEAKKAGLGGIMWLEQTRQTLQNPKAVNLPCVYLALRKSDVQYAAGNAVLMGEGTQLFVRGARRQKDKGNGLIEFGSVGGVKRK